MTKTSRSSTVISARVSSDTSAHFAALAARHHLSASRLLAKMVDEVLGAHGAIARGSSGPRSAGDSDGGVGATDRIALRLRNGDRALAAQRASARGMKTGSYLSMLIHNHVRASAVLPPDELDQIRAVVGQLAALGRQLRVFGMPNSPTGDAASELGSVITAVRGEVESARDVTAAVVRRNLISWETGHA
ncbi:hypothetical protein [Variovorax sp. OV084]|uniref:hypothetical protein n=1 Tax=Variovorax sp. OV084 TaxID=1882777 RepID=UPI000AA4E110|nr:hypothetical protein [Variovorax sp. OV084]